MRRRGSSRSASRATSTPTRLRNLKALKLRIHDDVRDRDRDNPHAALVRLGAEVAS